MDGFKMLEIKAYHPGIGSLFRFATMEILAESTAYTAQFLALWDKVLADINNKICYKFHPCKIIDDLNGAMFCGMKEGFWTEVCFFKSYHISMAFQKCNNRKATCHT